MADDTLPYFGPRELPRAETGGDARWAQRCPTCAQFYSGDARFCPYDGDPLKLAPEWDPSADPMIGQLIGGRYRVLGVLGSGGMGVVYHVSHERLHRDFALKLLRKELASEPDLAERFTREAKAAASVRSPHVVEITDFGELESGRPFFVMEYLAGTALSQLIARRDRMQASEVLPIVRQIAEALAAADDVGLVHRDLKPDNVFIGSGDGGDLRVKVLDFGLARVAGQSRLTRRGTVFGTPQYMSPEQASGEDLDGRSDLYALGVVMYEMLTGAVPFQADTFMGVLTQHIYVEPLRPADLPIPVAALGDLEAILLRCLEKKRERRYATAYDLLDALDAFEALPAAGVKEVPPGPVSRRARLASLLAVDAAEASGSPARSRSGAPTFVAGLALGTVLAVVVALALARSWGATVSHADRSSDLRNAPAVESRGAEPARDLSASRQPDGDPAVERHRLRSPAPPTLSPAEQSAPRNVVHAVDQPEPGASARAAADLAPSPPLQTRAPSAGVSESPRFHGREIVDPWAK